MRWNHVDWIALLCVTLLAAALRVYQIGVVPPGFQFDEAFNAIDAQQVLAGNRPLFLPANAGREVVYTYWQAFLVSLFGLNVRTLRLASAIFGILAIPVTYLLLRMMLRRDSRRIALFTSLVLATSLWHIHFSHYGIRVIMMPVVLSAAYGAFWLGHHAQRPGRQLAAYAVSGLCIGLSVWTHPSGRLAPFVALIYTAWLLWQEPASRRLRINAPLGGLLISGIVAFLVFLPLGLEFVRHPEFFTGHASEVSVFAERVSGDAPLAVLGRNILYVGGMFAVRGDREWTHNLAGRPVFDWLMALVFLAGVAIWTLRLVRGSRRTTSTGEADSAESDAVAPDSAESDAGALVLLAAWAGVMLLPSVFSEAAPNYSRTLPSLPALFVAAGLGLTWLAAFQWPFRHAGVALAALILVYSGSRSVYDYFVVFPDQEEVYYLYDADKLDALEVLAPLTEGNHVYLSQLWGSYHATVSMLRHELGIRSLDTGDTLVLPPPGLGAVYAFPSEQLDRAQQLAELWPEVQVRSVPDRFGRVLLYLVEVPPALASFLPERYAAIADAHTAASAAFAGAPDLLGQVAAMPDKQVTLLWAADEPMDASLTAYVHLIDADGRRVAQIDKLPGNGTYRTDEWTPGERVLERYYPALLDVCAAGVPLRTQVGWYAAAEGHAARPRADAPGDTALAGTTVLPVLSHDAGYLHPAVEASAVISDELTFLGYSLSGGQIEPGSTVTVDLHWRSDHERGSSPEHATTPLALALSAGGVSHTIWSGELAPDSDWDPGEEICRRIRARIPAGLEPGEYDVQITVGTGPGEPPRELTLQRMQITPSTRVFEAPPLDVVTRATLVDAATGDEIVLLGANAPASPVRAGEAFPLELVWQATAPPLGNYKTFVHLVDAAGNIVSQSDAIPGADYATVRWLDGEVVVDAHELAVPQDAAPGRYRIIAGLYDPVSAVRLEARAASGERYPDDGVVVHEIDVAE